MSIPFYTELKRLTGSTNAALLMQQNEHYFCYYPNGFYKFLTPCSIAECRPGDSWVEELECSKKELYGAFEGIRCIRYGSQAEFAAAESKGKIFGEDGQAWYCTWYDRASYKTMHLRNHAVVEAILFEAGYPPAVQRASDKREHAVNTTASASSQPGETDPSDKRELGQSTASDKRELGSTPDSDQVTKGNLTKLQKGTWSSDKRELVLIGTDITSSDIRSSDITKTTSSGAQGGLAETPPEWVETIAALMALPAPDVHGVLSHRQAKRLIEAYGLERVQRELKILAQRNPDNPTAMIQAVLKQNIPPPVARQTKAQRNRAKLINELEKETPNCG